MTSAQGQRFTALVLAARRRGDDAVAALGDCSHKCLLPIAGQTMLGRVLRALIASDAIGAVVIVIDDPAALAAALEITALMTDHDITLTDAAATPSLSVSQAIAALDAPWPVLVTTADLPLLSPEMVDHFCAEAVAGKTDVAVAVAEKSLVLARYPDASRTFIRFRGAAYTGCNLFALMNPAALAAVTFWRRVEADRKSPWRIFKAFGPLAIMSFLLTGATLQAALAAASRRLGLSAAAVAMPFAEAAIDVDKPDHVKLVEHIIGEQGDP